MPRQKSFRTGGLGCVLAALLLVLGCESGQDPTDAGTIDGGASDFGSSDSGGPDSRSPDSVDAARPDVPLDVPVAVIKPKLDLLFVIDNSDGMGERQVALAAALPSLFELLSAGPAGLPDLQVGVISSNVGAGPTQPALECPPGGDRGRLQVLADCGLAPTAGGFIRVDARGDTNIKGGVGNLAQVAGCMARLGIKGCGYEHQLLSLYFALDGKTNPEQNVFLRDDANLAVIVLSDEDDCSAAPNADFFQDKIPGQDGSLRCSLKGHLCGGNPIPAAPFVWPLKDCSPYERGPGEEMSRLIDVSFFVDFLKSRKRSPRHIFVGSIVGWTDDPAAQYRIGVFNAPTGPNSTEVRAYAAPICQDQVAGSANPAIRLHAFAKSFPNHGVYSICEADLSKTLSAIGAQILMLPPTDPGEP
jgi:hypothetical protein